MTSREIYNLIQSGNQKDAQQALFGLLGMVQELSTATIELAYHIEKLSGHDPLSSRPRLWLSEFLELPKRREK